MSVRMRNGTIISGDAPHLWSRWIYLRILGLLYVTAFLSLSSEIVGLVGPSGLFPAGTYLSSLAARIAGDSSRLLAAPTIAWLGSGAWALQCYCWVGVAAAVLVVVNRVPRLALVVCWVCYLSLLTIAPQFSWYASDNLLLEGTVLAVFAAPAGFRPGLGSRSPFSAGMLFLYQWLLFRLMLETGMSKVLSSDPMWRSLSTMDFFFETSPFPTWIAWFAEKLPQAVHQLFTAYVLFVEVGCSVLLFLGSRLRRFALVAWTVMHVGILLTANFNTFNYHSIALAILLAGDDDLRRVLPLRSAARIDGERLPERRWRKRAARGFLFFLFAVSSLAMLKFFEAPIPPVLSTLLRETGAFRSANSYQLYPVIPRQRRVIVFEGSNDGGKTWLPYEYRFQTQQPDVRPRFFAPFSPRFDREASRSVELDPVPPYTKVPYVLRTARALLDGEPSVLALFAADPFSASRPDMIRTVLYRYRFTDGQTLRQTGEWWSREALGPYSPAIVRDPISHEVRYVGADEHP
ncbi:MAG TPA: lipase maturation factor family protein [Candidatus Limnocylindrales bacterium]|nr:lipase maturation factor family protein [Candidatus Limnocylindrales bacterium]